MLLKIQDNKGNWHWIDNIESVSSLSETEAESRLAEGTITDVVFIGDPPAKNFILTKINSTLKLVRINAKQIFMCASETGATIDRIKTK